MAITLIAKVSLRGAKKDTKIKPDCYLHYPDYKDIRKGINKVMTFFVIS